MKKNLELERKDVINKTLEFEKAILNNKSDDIIKTKTLELDNAVTKFLKLSLQYEGENKKFIGKYKELLDKDYKEEIINMIKNDIVKNFRNIKNEELEQLSNNIYISATLKAYNIDSKEIIKQLMYRNHLFTSYMDEKGIDIDSNLSNLDAEDLIAIYKKHLKIIKERI